jgi:hypothetical protein
MVTKPRETGGTTTTTVPATPSTTAGPPSPSTTVPPAVTTTTVPPAGSAALVDAFKILEGMGLSFGTSPTLDALGISGKLQVDKSTGRVIAGSYLGQTKTVDGQVLQPQYFEGDEYDIATLDQEAVIGLQKQLKQGGYFLPNETFNSGIVRESTLSAYKRALVDANLSFMSLDQVLERSLTTPYSGGTGTLKKYKVTSAADLQNVFDKTSQSVLGRTLDQEQLNNLVKTYQDTELTSLKSQAGVSAQAPSAQAFGETRIEETNQDESDAYKFAQYAQVFEKLLGQ